MLQLATVSKAIVKILSGPLASPFWLLKLRTVARTRTIGIWLLIFDCV